MPREYKGPRLWLDRPRGTWTIVDRKVCIRTGCRKEKKDEAMERLRKYAGDQPIAPPLPPKDWSKRRSRRARQYGVYVVGYGDYIKIGISKDVAMRVATLQNAVPEKLQTLAVLDGWDKEERAFHARFSAYRLNGEWFRKEGELAEWIDGGCK